MSLTTMSNEQEQPRRYLNCPFEECIQGAKPTYHHHCDICKFVAFKVRLDYLKKLFIATILDRTSPLDMITLLVSFFTLLFEDFSIRFMYSRKISARESSAKNIMIIRTFIITCDAKWNGKIFSTIEMQIPDLALSYYSEKDFKKFCLLLWVWDQI